MTFVSLLLNAENAFKFAHLKDSVCANYLKMHFNIIILLYVLYLSLKHMHSIIVSDIFFICKKCELLCKLIPQLLSLRKIFKNPWLINVNIQYSLISNLNCYLMHSLCSYFKNKNFTFLLWFLRNFQKVISWTCFYVVLYFM